MHSKPLSDIMLHTLKPLALYYCTTCRIDFMIVLVVLSHNSSAVPNFISVNVFITIGICLLPLHRLLSIYFCAFQYS